MDLRRATVGLLFVATVAGCGGTRPTASSATPGAASQSAAAVATPTAKPVSFAGKTITIIDPNPAGGSTDIFARLVAPALERQLPGRPTVVVQNMPGGQQINGTNYVYKNDKGDGLLIEVGSSQATLSYILSSPGIEYDLRKMPLVAYLPTGNITYARTDSGLKTAEDLANPPKPVVYGGITGSSSADLTTAIIPIELLGWPIKVVLGYEGAGPVRLAVEKGEVNLGRDILLAYAQNVKPMIAAGKIVPLFQTGAYDNDGRVSRLTGYSDIPTLEDVYQKKFGKAPSGVGYDAYVMTVQAGYSLGLWMRLGPKTPQDIVDAYVASLDQMRTDDTFQKRLTELQGTPPVLGKQAIGVDKQLFDRSRPEVVEWLRKTLTKYGVKF